MKYFFVSLRKMGTLRECYFYRVKHFLQAKLRTVIRPIDVDAQSYYVDDSDSRR
jgi:hypothetical protein